MGNGFKDFYNDIRQEPDGSLGERMGSGSPKPIEPLKIFDAADWNGKETEPRLWVTIGQIPRGEPGILNGDGGTGKTTISLQLANAVADDQPDWLGKCVDTHGPTIIYSIEEKLKELHRRVAAIRESRNLPDLKRGRLLIISDLQDPVLAKPDSNGILKPTLTLHRLEKTVQLIKPALVIIENAADVFAGNENDRSQVHPFVRVMLGGLCVPSDAAVMLLQHPSLSGLSNGSGRSGSTGWSNAGRWRLNFKFDGDDDIRVLTTEKLNYGPKVEPTKLRWKNGVFVPAGSTSTPEHTAVEVAVESAFIACLKAKIAQGIPVGPYTGKNYAPSVFSRMPEANGYRSAAFESAMERLLSGAKIAIHKVGPKSKERSHLTLPTPFQRPD